MSPFEEADVTMEPPGPQNPLDDLEFIIHGALQEIEVLRKRNQEMSLRLDMFDDVMTLLRSRPAGSELAECIYPETTAILRKKLNALKYERQKKEMNNDANKPG